MNHKLVNVIAGALAHEDATEQDFMFHVAQALANRGYSLECHQLGIRGTEIKIVKQEEANAKAP